MFDYFCKPSVEMSFASLTFSSFPAVQECCQKSTAAWTFALSPFLTLKGLVVGRQLLRRILDHEQSRRIRIRRSLASGGGPACCYILVQNVLSFFSCQKSSSSPDLFSHFLCCRSVLFRLCFLCRWSQCFARLQHFLAGSCLFLDCMMHLRVLLLLLLSNPLFLGILSSPTSDLRSFPSTVVKVSSF